MFERDILEDEIEETVKNEEDNQIIIITAYYPDKEKWSDNYKTRIKK